MFSEIGNIKTKIRNKLGEYTLNSLLCVKNFYRDYEIGKFPIESIHYDLYRKFFGKKWIINLFSIIHILNYMFYFYLFFLERIDNKKLFYKSIS